ncbi:MAG: serine/threonine-protein phosphatase 6 regulatory ankyrin repeat subunit [Gammaproteobacteria bacterium]|jgi:ankyrin repeat protein|nr:serine/threonine-protein phosphatase 6 regulatory ankyrin repeat subunit [Gammaproteobacteria bacterium]
MTALHLAAARNHTAVIQKLHDLGMDLQLKDNNGLTALHHAADYGYVDAIDKLLQLHADIHAEDNFSTTALHHAATKGHISAIDRLVSAGANISAKDKNGLSSLHYAAEEGELAAIKKLVAMGANIEDKDNEGLSALHHAATHGHVDAINKLLELGADIHAKDKLGASPLHYAAANGKVGAIEGLLSAGANISAKDKDDLTPLHYASQNDEVGAICTLIALGANIEAKDKNRHTALDLAAAESNRFTMVSLIELGTDTGVKHNRAIPAFSFAAGLDNIQAVETLVCLDAGFELNSEFLSMFSNDKPVLAGILADNLYSKSDDLNYGLHDHDMVLNHNELNQDFIAQRLYHKFLKYGVPACFNEYLSGAAISDSLKTKIRSALKKAHYMAAITGRYNEGIALEALSEDEKEAAVKLLAFKIKCGFIGQFGIKKLIKQVKDNPLLKELVNLAISIAFGISQYERDLEMIHENLEKNAEVFLAHYFHIANPQLFPAVIPYSASAPNENMGSSANKTKTHESYLAVMESHDSILEAFQSVILTKLDKLKSLTEIEYSHAKILHEMLMTIKPLLVSNEVYRSLIQWRAKLKTMLDLSLSYPLEDSHSQHESHVFAGSLGAAGHVHNVAEPSQ